MKNKIGTTIGLIIGLITGFLFMARLIRIHPEEDIAPGLAVIVAILSGLFFALLGYLIQSYSKKNKTKQLKSQIKR